MSAPNRLLPPLALLAGLAACTPAPGLFAPDAPAAVPDPVNVVSFSSRQEALTFAPGATELAGSELEALRAGLSPAGLGRDHLVVVAPALPGDGLSEARADWTLAALRRAGVSTVRATPPLPARSGRAAEDGGVLLEIQQARVATPLCDGYPRAHSARVAEAASARPLGCTVTANLGAMVADPADLLRGRAPAPADGPQQVQAVETYRTAGAKSESNNPIAEAFAKAFGGQDK